jgi:N-acetylmuramoyl-L-alanine amidase
MKILVDPGHGFCPDTTGHWEFARSEHYGVREDLLTPFIAKRLFSHLEDAGHDVYTTRPFPGTPEGNEIGDSGRARWEEAALFWYRLNYTGHPLYEERGSSERGKAINSRPLLANQLGVDLAVSIHINASNTNASAHGTSVWHRNTDPKARRMAQLVYEEIVRADARYDGKRGIKGDSPGWEAEHAKKLAWFRRMSPEITPILVEFLFFTNRDDAKLLADSKHLDRAAQAIALGIEAHCQELEMGS